mmetsp:Transcript_18232/g.42751  ORF Transcript_18232/g.42751 Transcript_18232/m.42751 type:complete len:364 (-) Transcript_18232:160-1251(-)
MSAKATTCSNCRRRYSCHLPATAFSQASSAAQLRARSEATSSTSSREDSAMAAKAMRAKRRGPGLSGNFLPSCLLCPNHCVAQPSPSSGKRAASAAAAPSPSSSSPMRSQCSSSFKTPPRCSTQASTARPAAERTEGALSTKPARSRVTAAGPSSLMAEGCSESLRNSWPRTHASTSSRRPTMVPTVAGAILRPRTADARTAVHGSMARASSAVSASLEDKDARPRTAFSLIEGTLSSENSRSLSCAPTCSSTCAASAATRLQPCVRVALSLGPRFLPPVKSRMCSSRGRLTSGRAGAGAGCERRLLLPRGFSDSPSRFLSRKPATLTKNAPALTAACPASDCWTTLVALSQRAEITSLGLLR